ncbi:hypothetical protein Taro_044412, partial [Colocasia esculenta]|nr:hypothetical protein [Colocasia esculenta]
IVLYAIAMADYDQENAEDCDKLMKTKEGIASLSLYSSSIGSFAVYLSAKCDNALQGKDHVLAAMNTLFKLPGDSDDGKGGTNDQGEDSGLPDGESTVEAKPKLLWSALYIQEMTQVSLGSISYSPMPDGNLDYKSLLESTQEIFRSMYPQEEFFSATMAPDENDEDGVSQD